MVRKIFFVLFLILLINTGILLYLYYREHSKAEKLGPVKDLTEYIKEEEDDGYDLLLLGYGGAGHSGGGLSDALILLHVDKAQNKIFLIHIPRDLWVDIPIRSDESQKFKLNAAFAIGNDDRGYPYKETLYQGENGGGKLAMRVVGDTLKLRIDNFIAVDFGSYKGAIDALGGINVNVPVAFSDEFYPIGGLENDLCGKTEQEVFELKNQFSDFELEKQFKCRYETLEFSKGITQMDGETALKFVRSRHANNHGGDFARGERQIAVLMGIKDKLISLKALDDIPEFYNEFKGFVSTDLSLEMARSLFREFEDFSDYEVTNIGISEDNILESSVSVDGQSILIIKEGEDAASFIKSLTNS